MNISFVVVSSCWNLWAIIIDSELLSIIFTQQLLQIPERQMYLTRVVAGLGCELNDTVELKEEADTDCFF